MRDGFAADRGLQIEATTHPCPKGRHIDLGTRASPGLLVDLDLLVVKPSLLKQDRRMTAPISSTQTFERKLQPLIRHW